MKEIEFESKTKFTSFEIENQNREDFFCEKKLRSKLFSKVELLFLIRTFNLPPELNILKTF